MGYNITKSRNIKKIFRDYYGSPGSYTIYYQIFINVVYAIII